MWIFTWWQINQVFFAFLCYCLRFFLVFLFFSFPSRHFCKNRITTKNLIQFYVTGLFIYKYYNFNYYWTSFSITENLLTTTSYAIFSLYFIFKYSYWSLFTASFYQWIVFTYDLKKNYAIILFKQWPGSKWTFDSSHKVLLRESIFYSN